MSICPTCDKKLSSKGSLNRHIKSVHDKIKSHKCTYDDCVLAFA